MDDGEDVGGELVLADGAWTVLFWQITPSRTRSEHPEDTIEHLPIIDAWYPPRLVGRHRLNDAQLQSVRSYHLWLLRPRTFGRVLGVNLMQSRNRQL